MLVRNLQPIWDILRVVRRRKNIHTSKYPLFTLRFHGVQKPFELFSLASPRLPLSLTGYHFLSLGVFDLFDGVQRTLLSFPPFWRLVKRIMQLFFFEMRILNGRLMGVWFYFLLPRFCYISTLWLLEYMLLLSFWVRLRRYRVCQFLLFFLRKIFSFSFLI